MELKNKTYCKQIKFGSVENPSKILGIILAEDNLFLTIKTSRKTHRISRSSILEISDTDIEFREGGGLGW